MSAASFDFIVVGGGTAGIALATRLSENADQSVLVLEAGVEHSDNALVKIPAFYAALFGTDVDWGFQTVPQENLGGRPISLNQGKALGGSSVINAHVFCPPTRAILDDWNTLGNTGWDAATMAPYYTKAFTEPSTPTEYRQVLGVDGDEVEPFGTTNGPLQLSYPGDPWHPIRKIWAETFERKGRRMGGNSWVDASIGGFSNLSTIDPILRERCHAAKSYYTNTVRQRENLHVVLAAHVSKIIFADGCEGQQPKAVGVQYTHGGQTQIANAGKEIILSAGALQSPKLLELSGVGNTDILRRHGIEVVKDLPGVGENLQDHIVCDVSYAVAAEMDTLDALARQEPQALQEAMINYTQKQQGVLTSGGILTYAYLPTTDFVKDTEPPSSLLATMIAENHRQPSSTSPPTPEERRAEAYYNIAANTLLAKDRPSAAYLSALGQNPVAQDPVTGAPMPPQPGKYLTLATILAQPLSRGTTHITTSKDAAASPEIDPRYLSHPLDAEVFARSIAHLPSLARSAPLRATLRQPLQPTIPLAAELDTTNAHDADGEIGAKQLEVARKYMRSRAISMWHPAGTCAMLPGDMGGVVDDRLRVYGVSNLRVVDSSVVPLLPPGNLQSTVYALAERAADLIKDAHGLLLK